MSGKLRVGINGLGRIGRAFFRINLENDIFEIPIINDINKDIENIAYTLNYDSIYGKLNPPIKTNINKLNINGNISEVSHYNEISKVDWQKYDVDVVIDSSGQFLEDSQIDSLKNKIKNLVVTNAADNIKHSIVLGVNNEELDPKNNFVISSNICDATSGAVVLKIIDDNLKIVNGTLVTLHPWLGYQSLLDGSSVPYWKLHPDSNKVDDGIKHHYVLGRSAPMNIIPKSTSAVDAIVKVNKSLKDKIDSHSFRVPTQIVSGATGTLNVERECEVLDLIDFFSKYKKAQKFKIIDNITEPLTANDFIGEPYSAIVDHRWTSISHKKTIKIHYWYDNEWGYSSRVCDLVSLLSSYY